MQIQAIDLIRNKEFWRTLTNEQKIAVCRANAIQVAGGSTASELNDMDLPPWQKAQRRYYVEILETPPKQMPELFRKCNKSGDEIINAKYPDNIEVQIDRTEKGKVRLVVWKIGEDAPIFEQIVELPIPQGPSEDDVEFLTALRGWLAPEFSEDEVNFGGDYKSDLPMYDTFIKAGPYTVTKLEHDGDRTEYVLEEWLPAPYMALPTRRKLGTFTTASALAKELICNDFKKNLASRFQSESAAA